MHAIGKHEIHTYIYIVMKPFKVKGPGNVFIVFGSFFIPRSGS